MSPDTATVTAIASAPHVLQPVFSGTRITVRPYVDPRNDNMGLVKYNQALFDNCAHEEPLTMLELYGQPRYVTGLDEFAPEIDQILDQDARQGKIIQIRKNVAYLEQRLNGASKLDINDPEFWDKVKVLRPNNHDFWGEIKMVCGNDVIYLDPLKNPHDLIKLIAIEAGGFSMIAPSLEAARKSQRATKFFLDKEDQTLSVTTELKKLRNKAGGLLEALYTEDFSKLFYVAKVIDTNSPLYKKSTSKDVFYDNMDRFLQGELDGNKNKRENALKFIQTCELDMETLKIRSIIKDAHFMRELAARGDGLIYDLTTGTAMGKTQAEVLEFLKNPLNDGLLSSLTKKVELSWGM